MDFTLSTRVPVRVALPAACVAVQRVQEPCTVRTAAPAPLAGIDRLPGVAPKLGPAQGHVVPRLVPRPHGEQAVLATLSHYPAGYRASGNPNQTPVFLGRGLVIYRKLGSFGPLPSYSHPPSCFAHACVAPDLDFGSLLRPVSSAIRYPRTLDFESLLRARVRTPPSVDCRTLDFSDFGICIFPD